MTPDPLIDPTQTRQLRNLFFSAFTVMDIAEALASFDKDQPAETVKEQMSRKHQLVAGVREDGEVAGFVDVDELGNGSIADHMKPFDECMVLLRSASLAEAVCVLDRQPYAFVSILGQVSAVVTRADIQKPPMRMWLFGMVTILESNVTRAIRLLHPEGQWKARVSEGRIAKAASLQQERHRRGQTCDLLDCLQFSDKAYIIMKDPEIRAKLGYESARAGERVVKAMESLRNNLAHSQDILSHDWKTIVDLSEQLDGLLEARGLRKILEE